MLTYFVLVCLVIETLLVVVLLKTSIRGNRALKILAQRDSLEKAICGFSARLPTGEGDQLGELVETEMRQLLTLSGASRMCWYSKPEDSPNLQRVYSVSKVGTPPSPLQVTPDDIPYAFDRLMKGETLILQGEEELLEHAQAHRRFFRDHGIGSLILIPSKGSNGSRGVLGIASLTEEAVLSPELISQFGMFGELIAAAVERQAVHRISRETEQRFRCLFREAPVGIALENPAGNIQFVNPALCSMLGYSEEELHGITCALLSDPEDEQKERVLFEQLLAGSIKRYKVEKRFVHKNGSRVWGRVDVSLLKDRPEDAPMIVGMVEDITEQTKARRDVDSAQTELRQLAHSLIQAQDHERRLISRELHDDIAQRLTLFAIELDLLSRSLAASGQDREGNQASLLHSRVTEITRDVHRLSHELHSSKLQHLGLRAALDELCARVSKHTLVTMDFREDARLRLSPEVELCLYRVAQEAMNNVMKHSKAERLIVRFSISDGVARLQITDSGIGFNSSTCTPGLGLVSMRERLRILGGTLTVTSVTGMGTEVIAELRAERQDIMPLSAA